MRSPVRASILPDRGAGDRLRRPGGREVNLVPTANTPLRGRDFRICHFQTHAVRKKTLSVTSSARPDKGSGTVMPSARADFALMNSSSLVPCWTGRSAGFSPLRRRRLLIARSTWCCSGVSLPARRSRNRG